MSVDIDLELDAGDATGKIGAVASSLKGLEMVADDIDIDFDADVGEITDEIDDFAEALGNIEVGNITFLDELDKSTKRLERAMDGEIDLNLDRGETNAGDSTGGDPPFKTSDYTFDFPNAVDSDTAEADGSGSGSILRKTIANLEDRNGLQAGDVKAFQSKRDDLISLQKDFYHNVQGNEHPTRNFNPPEELIDDGISLGTNQGFGTEGPDMSGRRDFYFSDAEISELKELNVGSDDGISSLKKRKLRSDLANLYGGDFLNDENLNPLGMKPPRQKSFENLRNVETGLGRGDMEQAVAGDYGFGTEPSSMGGKSGKRITQLTPDERVEIGEDYNVGGTWADGDDEDIRSNYDFIENNGILRRAHRIREKSDRFDSITESTQRFGRKLRKLKPTMGKYMQLFAALIPIAVALGTQLLGVAAAMGSVAVAGGAIMGLGLLGHGESMQESFGAAKQEVRDLKQELFQVAQPTMQQFAPIQARMFDAIPESLDGIFEEMEGLAGFEDTLFALGGDFTDGVEEFFAIINNNQQTVSQLSKRFGRLIGSGLLDFFEWIIQAASKNQDLLVAVGREMVKLAIVAYNLSMAITRAVVAFSPFFDLLLWISNLLNGAVMLGIIAMIGYLLALGKAAMIIYTLAGAFNSLFVWILQAEIGMLSYITTTWGAVAATLALVAAVGALTLGTSLLVGGAVTAAASGSDVVGGPSGSVGGRGRTKNVYNDNRSFTINNGGGDDYASQKAMEDTVKKVGETESAQDLPPVAISGDSDE